MRWGYYPIFLKVTELKEDKKLAKSNLVCKGQIWHLNASLTVQSLSYFHQIGRLQIL